MHDLIESARMFDASSRLQSAASLLASAAGGGAIDRTDDNLKWAGDFLTQVDWSARVPSHQGIGGSLAMQAVEVRPLVYASLMSIAHQLSSAGINTAQDISSFLSALYG